MATLELPALIVDAVTTLTTAERPLLMNRDPGPDERAVPIDTLISLELIDTGESGVARASTQAWVNGALAFDGSSAVELQPGFDGPQATVSSSSDTLRVTLHPTSFFASESRVTVRVVSAVVGAGQLVDTSYSFTIEDQTAPQLVAGQATGQRALSLSFSEPVVLSDPSDLSEIRLSPLDRPAVPVSVIDAQVDGALIQLTLNTEMTPDARYELTVSGVQDRSGNQITPPLNRVALSGFRPPRPESRRFDLWSMLPKHNRREDVTGDLSRFIACLQEVTDLLLVELDRFPELFDLERAPERFLDLILSDLGNPFPFLLDPLGKRRLASVLVEMYRQKGTARGIMNAVRFFLGVELQAVTSYGGEALVLGESLLGEEWTLGPSDRFARYAFDVVVNVPLTDTERRQLRALVEYLKPAHTHFVDLIEPAPAASVDHWELGVSELGVSADLH